MALINSTVTSINARQVTGYSYATLYNYFPNISTLFQYCIHEHILKMNDYILNHSSLLDLKPRDRIKQLSKLVTDYFLKHPKSFELMFIAPLTVNPPIEISKNLLEPKAIINVRISLIEYYKELNILDSEYETITQVILGHLIGKLLFYFKRTINQDANLLLDSIDKEVDWLLQSIERSPTK